MSDGPRVASRGEGGRQQSNGFTLSYTDIDVVQDGYRIIYYYVMGIDE